MAYFVALASVVQLLDDLVLQDRYPDLPISKEVIVKSIHEKFSCMEELLRDYLSKGNKDTDRVEGRIKDVAHRVQFIIESEIQYEIDSKRGTHPAEKFSYHSTYADMDYWRHKNERTQVKTPLLQKPTFVVELSCIFESKILFDFRLTQ